jgi:hypothetical protein
MYRTAGFWVASVTQTQTQHLGRSCNLNALGVDALYAMLEKPPRHQTFWKSSSEF